MNNSNSLRSIIKCDSLNTILYIILFFIFALQILPNDLILAVSILVFLFTDLENNIYLYLFSLPWMYVATFSFGLSISLVNTVLLVLKILLRNKKIKFNYLELIVLLMLTATGFINLILKGSLTGISFCLYFLVATYIHSTYAINDDKCESFWENTLFLIMISTAICVIYGLRAGTSIDRAISGYGHAKQLYGTLGTSRFGLYLALSLLYPIYHINNKLSKIIISLVIVMAIIQTVSMTSLILLLFILSYYVVTEGKISAGKICSLLTTILLIVLTIAFWEKIGNIDAFKPLHFRVNSVITNLQNGDLNSATTGRYERSGIYIDMFFSSSIINRIFGNFELSSIDVLGYSHNSYIDALNYCGLFGTVLFAILQLQRIIGYTRTAVAKQAILAKLLFIIVAFTVSVFSAQYWQMFFFM